MADGDVAENHIGAVVLVNDTERNQDVDQERVGHRGEFLGVEVKRARVGVSPPQSPKGVVRFPDGELRKFKFLYSCKYAGADYDPSYNQDAIGNDLGGAGSNGGNDAAWLDLAPSLTTSLLLQKLNLKESLMAKLQEIALTLLAAQVLQDFTLYGILVVSGATVADAFTETFDAKSAPAYIACMIGKAEHALTEAEHALSPSWDQKMQQFLSYFGLVF